MRNIYALILLVVLNLNGWAQSGMNDRGLLQAFKDDVEWHADFATENLEGWIVKDLDGLNTAGPYFEFPGKGGPLGFIPYNILTTSPPNNMEAYIPKSGSKFFSSISSWDANSNDWLISKELASHQGGKFTFWAKAPFDFFGDENVHVAYSMTGTESSDFTFLTSSPLIPSTMWQLYEYDIPAGAKHVAINCVSYAYFLMVDDISFSYNLNDAAPGVVNNYSSSMELGAQIKAHLNWTNPTIDVAGNALSDITGIKIYRGTHPMNLQEIADITGSAGQAMSYTDILPASGFYLYRIEPYNAQGRGKLFDSSVTFYGYESTPAAPTNITFTQNDSQHTVISWSPVVTGSLGGELESPVAGYTITRKLGSAIEVLATMHPSTSFTEATIPALNIYTYTITANISETQIGVPASVTAYSGLAEDQFSVSAGNTEANQPFELSRGSILTQSIYTAEQLGSTGLITQITWFGNLGEDHDAVYKVYMSNTTRETFGSNNTTAIWEYFGDQKLVYNGNFDFQAGLGPLTITLDQPYYFNAETGENVIITIVKPLTTETSSMYPSAFMNTRVDGTRTYYAIGYATDMSQITTQPASWATEAVTTIPSIVTTKNLQYASVTGNTTIEDGSTPLADVTVTITPADTVAYQSEITLTSVDGNYEIPALLPGNYIITFSKETFNDYTESFTVAEGQTLVINAALVEAIPIVISGIVEDATGNGIEGVSVSLSGFSSASATTDETGNFQFNAFANKSYTVTASHPLFIGVTNSFTSEETDFTLETITLNLNAIKPLNVVATNNNDNGVITWEKPEGTYNETTIGWGSFSNTGNGWGDGGDEFIAGIRFEVADIANMIPENGKLTHIKAYVSNYAEIILEVYQGENASELIYSQPISITDEGWYTFELDRMIPIDPTKELWIALHYLPNYGAYPIGIDEGPNAPAKKGSMLYSGGVWNQMSLTNKNWNIYGIINNTLEANPDEYQIFRKQTNETDWALLTQQAFENREYIDETLAAATPGIYHYAVKALYGETASESSVSNDLLLQMVFDLTIDLDPDFGTAENAYISISNEDHYYEATVPAGQDGITINNMWRGDYQVYVQLDNYQAIEMPSMLVTNNQTVEIPLTLVKAKPSNLNASYESEGIELNWSLHSAFTDKMETYVDFERSTISNYILRDLDGFETYTYTNFTWPDAGIPMSYMVFNPFTTTPAVDLPTWSGRRVLTAFAGPDGVNNDWLIIPAGGGQFAFMASSLTTSGLEKFRVLYSTTGNQTSDFTQIGNIITCPVGWTEYTYDIPADAKYVAINYVSFDTYFLMIDDITFEKEYDHALSYNIYVDGNIVASGITEQNYTLTNLSIGNHLVEVEAVYNTGVSQRAQINILGVNTEDIAISEFQIYPNPSQGTFNINLTQKATVTITDLGGKQLYSNSYEAGNSIIDLDLSNGTYIIHILTTDGVKTAKLIIL